MDHRLIPLYKGNFTLCRARMLCHRKMICTRMNKGCMSFHRCTFLASITSSNFEYHGLQAHNPAAVTAAFQRPTFESPCPTDASRQITRRNPGPWGRHLTSPSFTSSARSSATFAPYRSLLREMLRKVYSRKYIRARCQANPEGSLYSRAKRYVLLDCRSGPTSSSFQVKDCA